MDVYRALYAMKFGETATINGRAVTRLNDWLWNVAGEPGNLHIERVAALVR